jgi:hypothetical protein
MAAESGAYRVLDDVAADGCKLLLVLDGSAPEPVAEEVAPAAVACVEPLGIAAVQALESRRKLRHGRLDDEVVVIRHQAEGMEAPVVLAHDRREQAQEEAPVVVVAIDRDLPGPTRRHVKVAVGEDVSRQTRHAVTVRRGAR